MKFAVNGNLPAINEPLGVRNVVTALEREATSTRLTCYLRQDAENTVKSRSYFPETVGSLRKHANWIAKTPLPAGGCASQRIRVDAASRISEAWEPDT